MSKVLNVLIVVVLLALLGYKFLWPTAVTVGESAPAIERTLVNGNAFKLADFKGDYVLVDFWGSWCPPCRKANKELVPFYQKWEGKKFKDGGQLQILSVAIEKQKARALKAIERDNLYWDHHIIEESRFLLQNPLALAYKVSDVPALFLINKEGHIMGKNLSFEEIDKLLMQRM